MSELARPAGRPLAVIVPTRSRPQNVRPIADAWRKTGAYDAADLWWVTDGDDDRLPEYRRQFEWLRRWRGEQNHVLQIPQWRPLVPKLNDAAHDLRRSYQYPVLAFMGDDHIPRTDGWADTLVSYHSRRPGFIYYGRDGLQDRRLPTWWSMDGRIVETLGRMVPAPVQHLYCDNAIKALGEKTGRLGYLPDVMIEHMHPVAGKGIMDAQYARVNRRQQYDRDSATFRAWVESGLDQDATLLAGIWG